MHEDINLKSLGNISVEGIFLKSVADFVEIKLLEVNFILLHDVFRETGKNVDHSLLHYFEVHAHCHSVHDV